MLTINRSLLNDMPKDAEYVLMLRNQSGWQGAYKHVEVNYNDGTTETRLAFWGCHDSWRHYSSYGNIEAVVKACGECPVLKIIN